ncbi:MAG: DUF3570 domain-containing protein [Cellvibrionaceae bacterium]
MKTVTKILFLLAATSAHVATAAVLPEDRADILFHSYEGGGATINGPSVLVRKGIKDTVSVYANYYVDMVTSATIDVEVQGASEYEEERTEYSVGVDYLFDKTIMSLGFTNSSENDYEADTIGFGISQDFFGDLTNISLGFSYGSDTVSKTVVDDTTGAAQAEYVGDNEHRRYKLGISQILTKDFLIALNFESVIDSGFLNNPYRQVRALDATTGFTSAVAQPENYPETRNSDAFAIRGLYYLPYRASVGLEFRSFSDSWGIQASSYELKYVHPIESLGLVIEGKIRSYSQTQADFYSDLFPYNEDPDNLIEFRARDKEMSTFDTSTFGLGVTYEFPKGLIPYFEKASANLYWDHIQFDYDNFRDARPSSAPVPPALGQEPLYTFNANVVRLFLSFWY